MKPGRVALVGAGPGDPGLLTVRASRCLEEAEVIVYDRLVNPALLDLAPPDTLRIFAGKRAGAHCLPQAAINALLVHHAEAGRFVVRLKSGDPFVFGRGGEEALALAKAGIAFEIVPGISSAIAVPAYAGIPVTHRGIAASFAVLTGHEDPSKTRDAVDWRKLATAVDTLVVLMAAATFPRIVGALLAHGRASGDTRGPDSLGDNRGAGGSRGHARRHRGARPGLRGSRGGGDRRGGGSPGASSPGVSKRPEPSRDRAARQIRSLATRTGTSRGTACDWPAPGGSGRGAEATLRGRLA